MSTGDGNEPYLCNSYSLNPSDTPFVTDTSFTSILNGLLGPTPSLEVQSTGLGGVEPGVDPIHNVEHDIESWATENFPSSSARSVPESPAEQPAEDGANSASDQICYGMVSLPTYCFCST